MKQVVRFESEKFLPVSRLESLANWLSGSVMYPFGLPHSKAVFYCEGTRLLLNYWMFLGVVRPEVLNRDRWQKVSIALRTAQQNAASADVEFIQKNTAARLNSFERNFDHAGYQPDLRVELPLLYIRFQMLLKNSLSEFEMQDVSTLEFEEFGIFELLEINSTCLRACKKIRDAIQGIDRKELNDWIGVVRQRLTECSRKADSASKREFVDFGRAVFTEVTESAEQLKESIQTSMLSNASYNSFDKNDQSLHDSTTNSEEAHCLVGIAGEEIVENNRHDRIVEISKDPELEKFAGKSSQGREREWEKCQVWLSLNLANQEVVFYPEWEGDSLRLHIAYAGDSLSEAVKVRRELIKVGIKEVARRYVHEFGTAADSFSWVGVGGRDGQEV